MRTSESLVGLLRDAHRILVFTGAGISTGSGIPDFRGPQGLWKRYQPVYFDEFQASEERRVEYWVRKAEMYESFTGAMPNPAHEALVALERLGKVQALVTQNIDGLHQDAGSSAELIIEVHGTNRWVECLSCDRRVTPEDALARFVAPDDGAPGRAPRCDCGGLLKPATISFGQSLRTDVLERAFAEAARADLVLALGSTLSVHPAAAIPLAAVESGAPYAIINRGRTDHDEIATLKIDDDVTRVLPPAVAALQSEAA